MGSAGGGECSFGRLQFDHGLERVDFMPARKGDEGLLARFTVRQIGLEDALDRLRRVYRLGVAIEPAAERGIRPEAAADQQVIALDRVAVLGLLYLASEQADLTDKMLRAGMMTAGEMNIDRRVEGDG